MLAIGQLPSLWDPWQLFFHLALWAGVPAAAVIIMITALAWYKSVGDWINFSKSAVHGAKKLLDWTPEKLRALARLAFFSVIMVAFSYMATVVISAVVQLLKVNPYSLYSMRPVETVIVTTAWPPAAVWTVAVETIGIGLLGIASITELQDLQRFVLVVGGVARAAAGVAGAIITVPNGVLLGLELAIDAGLWALSLLSGSNGVTPPSPLYVTGTVTGILIILVAWSMDKVAEASGKAFVKDDA